MEVFSMVYNYKKQLKWVSIGLSVVIIIFVTIYYASVTRAENLEVDESGYNLKSIVDFVKQLIPGFDVTGIDNAASLNQVQVSTSSNMSTKVGQVSILEESSLNRELLDICLAKAESEWNQLQKHYRDVLIQCINIDLGLNGEKLFSNDECDSQIKPYRDKDKQRIQEDKADCFIRYSERE